MKKVLLKFIVYTVLFSSVICAHAQVKMVNDPVAVQKTDSVQISTALKPHSPKKAVLLSAIFPGAGQFYNKKYWKLPIVYGGMFGIGYAIKWNNDKYKDFKKGLLEVLDDDPDTNHHEGLLPYTLEEFIELGLSENDYYDYAKDNMLRARDQYRRYRDLNIIAITGFYLLQILDASVDAHFKNFDIGDDLSLNIEPITTQPVTNDRMIGVQCNIKF